MENTERMDPQSGQAGGTPYHEDEPIKGGRPGEDGANPNQGEQSGQGGKSDESGRIGQGGSDLEDEDDENKVGSTPKSEPGEGDSTQNPAMQVNAPDETPKTA